MTIPFLLIIAAIVYALYYIFYHLPKKEREETGLDTKDINNRDITEKYMDDEPFYKWFKKEEKL